MKHSQLLSLSLAAGITLGCTQTADNEPTAQVDILGPGEVAIVDGERIPESLFRLYTLLGYQVNADDLTQEGKNQFIEELVYLRVLADEAERQGLDQERRIAAELELQRIQHLARAMTQRYTEENPPTESELRDLYEQNLPRLMAPEYKTRHILVETEAEAADLLEQLKQGADFAELAREHSTDASTAPQGGDLGWSSADNYVQPFAEAVRAATPGVPVDTPIQTQYGWHVILVDEKKDQVAPGLEAVREDLTVAARARKLDTYAAGLREAAEVTIVE
jgi:peptidyl-prolyl cis-trans isomerase C